MPVRGLVVLGTASQAPTRHRNHNGYLLRRDSAGLLFDPGPAAEVFDGDIVVASDLVRVPVPRRCS